jgi:hypothetical protein
MEGTPEDRADLLLPAPKGEPKRRRRRRGKRKPAAAGPPPTLAD